MAHPSILDANRIAYGPWRSAFGGMPEVARRTWNLDRGLKHNCQLGFEEEESTLQCASYGHLAYFEKSWPLPHIEAAVAH
jgi:hypothetical protein